MGFNTIISGSVDRRLSCGIPFYDVVVVVVVVVVAMLRLFALYTMAVMSQFVGQGTRRVAGESISLGVSAPERTTLILAVNTVRGDVRPMAANMAFVVWNTSLEDSAQAWVDACNYSAAPSSDDPAHVMMAVHRVDTMYSFDSALKAWLGQGAHFDHREGTCEDGANCDQYVALVSATAHSFGCGIARWSQFY